MGDVRYRAGAAREATRNLRPLAMPSRTTPTRTQLTTSSQRAGIRLAIVVAVGLLAAMPGISSAALRGSIYPGFAAAYDSNGSTMRGLGTHASLLAGLAPGIGVGLEGGVYPMGTGEGLGLVTQLTPLVRITPATGAIRPFAVAGAGVYSGTGGVIFYGLGTRQTFGFNLGGGVQVKRVGFEGRLHSVPDATTMITLMIGINSE